VLEMSGAGGASLGTASIDLDGVGPQPSDDTWGSLWDLVMCGVSFGIPGHAAPGDAAPAPGSLDVVCLGISGLLLPGSPGFLPLPIDGRQVEDNVEFVRS
jgi:hypothetical protein